MGTLIYDGQTSWEVSRDREGHREYLIKHRVKTTDPAVGPFEVLNAPGLPRPGDFWNFDQDQDLWAYCLPDAKAKPEFDNEPCTEWTVEQTFSTKPPDPKFQRCNDQRIDDPILEPQKISGGVSKYTEEATHDRFGRKILNSAHEVVRGAHVEFDRGRPTVRIEQNVPLLQASLIYSMQDCVNDRPLWGLPKRTVKLSNISWERKYYGLCYAYYTRTFEFEVNYQTWDRELLDEGTKVLKGYWDIGATEEYVLENIAGQPPKADNPSHFIRFKDRNGENTRVILDGKGEPYNPNPAIITDCPVCEDGTVFQWKVTGFESLYNEGGFFIDPNGRMVTVTPENNPNGVILTATADPCTWQGSFRKPGGDRADVTYTLTYVTDEDLWQFSADNLFQGERWTRDNEFWACRGSNVLALDGPLGLPVGNHPEAPPSNITVTPYSTSQPGTIRVEKYEERNFLLLGIPLVL